MIENDESFNKKWSKSKNPVFLTVDTRQAFIWLRKDFTKAPILSHFNWERHIQIEITCLYLHYRWYFKLANFDV